MRWKRENDFDAIINRYASEYGVPVPLVKAMISLESGFNPKAYRAEKPRSSLPPTPDFPKGGDASYGLMQLLVRTARALGYKGTKEGLYDPATNIELGTRFLRDLVREAHRRGVDLDSAISAYNGGWRPSLGFGIRKNGKFGNQDYVNVVKSRLSYFTGASATPIVWPTAAPLFLIGLLGALWARRVFMG